MTCLPSDIFYLISYLLSQRDILECMTVCRQWNHALHHTLFRDVSIHSQEELDKLVESVRRDPILGTKVSRLMLKLRLDENFDVMTFAELFPNLRNFSSMTLYDSLNPLLPLNPHQSHPWLKCIETVVEAMSTRNIKTLLHSGICKSLSHLSVRGHGDSASSIVALLVNAPALTILKLDDYKISFENLELLHESLPFLNTLAMKNITFDYNTIPRDIKPSNSIKSLQYLSCNFSYMECYDLHLRYISQKYTQLEELAYEIKPHYLDDDDETMLDSPEVKAMLGVYLKTLGPRLKTLLLSLEMSRGEFDFYMLDECGCQIQKLSLVYWVDLYETEQLMNTSQVKCIQSLSINRLVYDYQGPIPLDWLKQFSVLKELTLHFGDGYAFENRYVLNLPTLLNLLREVPLETLSLHYVKLVTDADNTTLGLPLIKNVTLSSVTLGKNTDELISQSLPNLKHLNLEDCIKEDEPYMFQHSDLYHLEVSSMVDSERFDVLVITLSNQKQRLYHSSRRSPLFNFSVPEIQSNLFAFSLFSSQPYGESMDRPSLTIVCNSLYEFSMKNIKT